MLTGVRFISNSLILSSAVPNILFKHLLSRCICWIFIPKIVFFVSKKFYLVLFQIYLFLFSHILFLSYR